MQSTLINGSARNNPMISVIEDDSSVREAIEFLLQSAGMECQSFDSAEQFLGKFTPCLNDLIVLDLNLPGISGCELLKKIESHGWKVQVIVATAFDDPYSREMCRQYGALAYLRKPVDGVALIDIIRYNLPISTIDKNQKHHIKLKF